jgi:hypothetical protein
MKGHSPKTMSEEMQVLPSVSLLPQTSTEGMPLQDLQVDGELAWNFVPITTRCLI